ELDKATGSKKGAVRKHLNRILEGLLGSADLSAEDASIVEAVDTKNLNKARDLGNGLLAELLETAPTGADENQIRELANDLCLRTDGKIRKEDLDALVQWLVKVREMYQDIESRRADTREAAEDSRR